MFRGKESSNRIELSRLVQHLLNFGVLGSLQLWGGGSGWIGVGGGWGCPHTCAQACACMHTHACMVNMIIPCKWPPPLDLGKSRGFPMMSYMHVHACIRYMCMCVGDPVTTPTPIHPSPRGEPQNQSKFNST